jgi:hypothetical protein
MFHLRIKAALTLLFTAVLLSISQLPSRAGTFTENHPEIRRIYLDPKVLSKDEMSHGEPTAGYGLAALFTGLILEEANSDHISDMKNSMKNNHVDLEQMSMGTFRQKLAQAAVFSELNSSNPDATLKLSITSVGMETAPLGFARKKPYITLMAEIWQGKEKRLWRRKGEILTGDDVVKGATYEEYKKNPERLRADYQALINEAVDRIMKDLRPARESASTVKSSGTKNSSSTVSQASRFSR